MLPTDWIIREKSLATIGFTPRAKNKQNIHKKKLVQD